jgi:tRNA G18 (ribose-2'-O)-methylase SpoU
MSKTINIAEERDAALIQSNSSLNVHDNVKHLSIPELQELSQLDRLPWHTMCLNLTGDLNVGTVVRTSHIMGATSAIIVGRAKMDRRSLVGASNYIKLERISTLLENNELDIAAIAKILSDRNLTPVFCECGGTPLNTVNWKLRLSEMFRLGTHPCLVMGNETGGLPANIIDLINYFPNSFVVSIPQRGVIRSLNVSVAHSMIAGHMIDNMGWFNGT